MGFDQISHFFPFRLIPSASANGELLFHCALKTGRLKVKMQMKSFLLFYRPAVHGVAVMGHTE